MAHHRPLMNLDANPVLCLHSHAQTQGEPMIAELCSSQELAQLLQDPSIWTWGVYPLVVSFREVLVPVVPVPLASPPSEDSLVPSYAICTLGHKCVAPPYHHRAPVVLSIWDMTSISRSACTRPGIVCAGAS